MVLVALLLSTYNTTFVQCVGNSVDDIGTAFRNIVGIGFSAIIYLYLCVLTFFLYYVDCVSVFWALALV